jgi:hypothetical protein
MGDPAVRVELVLEELVEMVEPVMVVIP